MEYRKLGRFNLEESVARGGMGEIIKSMDDSGRPIALKKILEEHLGDPQFRELFFREAEVTFQLDHPNIIKAYRFDRLGNQLVLALEYLDGVNLKDILREVYSRKLVIPSAIVFAMMERILSGLDYAHKKKDSKGNPLGIIHRDLNPSNLFVTFAGEVKILDFGISKAMQKEIHQLTPAGELRGKMCYLSPEQIRGNAVDHRSDVFTTGIVLWELLAGQPLYLRSSDTEVMEAIAKGEYRSIRDIRPELPAVIDEIILRALAVSPKNRFRDAAAFLSALVEALRSHSMPGIGEEEIGIFARALFNKRASESDPHFLAGYAWLVSQMPGREKQGVDLIRRLHEEHPQRPYVLLNYARVQLSVGDRNEGLRLMRKLARSDAMEEVSQEILEWLGVRRRPVIPFLKRSNPANFLLGQIRHRILGPTPYQQEFIAA